MLSLYWLEFLVMSEDSRFSQYDLRLKLMRKSLPKQIQDVHEENRRTDLRVKLSKTVQPPLSRPMLQYKSETRESTLFRKIPPRQSADDLFLVNSLGNSYSSRTPNGLRARSTERNLKTSSGISTPRSFNELWKVPSLREFDASRAGRFPSFGVANLSQPTGPMPFTVKPIPETAKRVAPASCSLQQNSLMVLFSGFCTSTWCPCI